MSKSSSKVLQHIPAVRDDEQVREFATSGEAWAFMRECEERGAMAGYPSLTAPYKVRFYEVAS